MDSDRETIASADALLDAGLAAVEGNGSEFAFEVFADEAALSTFNQATRSAPDDARFWLGRGLALQVRDKPQAIGAFVIAAALDPPPSHLGVRTVDDHQEGVVRQGT